MAAFSLERAVELIREGRLQQFNGVWKLASVWPGEPAEWTELDVTQACVANAAHIANSLRGEQ